MTITKLLLTLAAVGQMDKVTQSNAANAEESAAATQELNAQAVTMKQSVADLLKLVDGQKGLQPAPVVATPVPRAHPVSRSLPSPKANGNGHAQAEFAAMAGGGRKGIPLEDDFKDF